MRTAFLGLLSSVTVRININSSVMLWFISSPVITSRDVTSVHLVSSCLTTHTGILPPLFYNKLNSTLLALACSRVSLSAARGLGFGSDARVLAVAGAAAAIFCCGM